MLKSIKSILFVICVVMVFTAQTYRLDNQGQQRAPAAARQAPVERINQNRPQVQVQNRREAPRQEAPRQEPPRQVVRRAPPTQQTRQFQPPQQVREVPRVYAFPAPAVVSQNRFLNRQHHNNWRPRYNFYDNQYHFYPYVNIASTVELTGGYVVTGPDGQNYYYDQGTFYLTDQSGQYGAVVPPVGIIVNPLASGARQIIVNGQVFYRYKGVFYLQVAQGYQVVGPVQLGPDET